MANIILMRWNPAISSYKLDVYHRNCADFPYGFRIDWSVWDYQEVHAGDYFVMMRVGDYNPGIVFYGNIVSEPYADEDWAGTDKKRYYVMMDCFGFTPDDQPIISAEELQNEIPTIDWMHGHSGVLLPEQIAEAITQALEKQVQYFTYDPDDNADGWFDAVDKLPELMERFKRFAPSIHTCGEEEYDWLDSDEEWCKCLLIPNPANDGNDIEVATEGEFILYFAGSHAHFDNDNEGYAHLLECIEGIVSGKECAYSCMYEGWGWSSGLNTLEPSEECVKEFLKKDDEYFIRMLGEYTERDVRVDGIITLELRYFDSRKNKTFAFRLDELSDRIGEYRAHQDELKRKYPS